MLPVSFWLSMAVFLSLVGLIGFVWQLSNLKGYKLRGRTRRPADKRRQSDLRKLTRNEKRLLSQARTFMKTGRIGNAAQILETIGMTREAIGALESAGLIHDACRILLRMQRPNRAGVVYARHAMWKEAAECFKAANMPLEAAKCAREGGQLLLAGELFEKANRLQDAAEAFAGAGNFHRAARLFAANGQKDRALEFYQKIARNAEAAATVNLNDKEIQLIMEYLSEGGSHTDLADMLVSRNKLAEVIRNLIKKNRPQQAADLYLRSASDIGPQLIALLDLTDNSGMTLAEMFLIVRHFEYAGMVFERLGAYDRAGDAFAQGENFERAAACADRAGDTARAREHRRRLKSSGSGGARPESAQSAFSLAVVSSTQEARAADQRLASQPSPQDRTTIVAIGRTEDTLQSGEDAPNEQSHHAPDRVRLDDTRAIFHQAEVWTELDYEQKTALWSAGETAGFDAGEIIVDYKSEPRGIYVVLAGAVRCLRHDKGSSQDVITLGAGQCFGELWLLTDEPTSTKFVASESSRVHVIGKDAFLALMDKDGTLARKIYKRFTHRLMDKLTASPLSELSSNRVA